MERENSAHENKKGTWNSTLVQCLFGYMDSGRNNCPIYEIEYSSSVAGKRCRAEEMGSLLGGIRICVYFKETTLL